MHSINAPHPHAQIRLMDALFRKAAGVLFSVRELQERGVMETRAFQTGSLDDLQTELAQLSSGSFQPQLAIVFASIEQELEALRQIFNQAGIAVFGATSAGEILERGDDNSVYADSLVVMLFQFTRPDAFKVKLFPHAGQPSLEVGHTAGEWIKAAYPNPAALVMISGLQNDGEQVVHGIIERTSPDLPLYGGLAGDDLKLETTYVFDGTQVSSSGVLVLVFDGDQLEIQGLASSGWQAVGGKKTVTHSEGNVVYMIDNIPALDVYNDYLGIEEGNSITMAAEYPLQIVRDEGYSVMRAALLIDREKRSLIYAGTVPQGVQVRFCVPPGTDIIDHALEEISGFWGRNPKADALILFSCKGRHQALGPMAEDEIKPLQQLWKAPLIGFYTYGEIGRGLDNHLDFHNNTCVMVTLKEREA